MSSKWSPPAEAPRAVSDPSTRTGRPRRSLFFWQYNRGKRSIVLDLRRAGRPRAIPRTRRHRRRAAGVHAAGRARQAGPGRETPCCRQLPTLIVARMSPFGDHGPWADFKASDLVHLALGGVMMNCGYDPAPDGTYDLPPIAPQMWHAYHIAGEQLTVAIIAALLYRWRTGKGQRLSCAIHEAVAKSTEVDLMSWVMRRVLVVRQTCRHARETVSPHPSIVHTKDGRWVMANLGTRPGEAAALIGLARALRHGGRARRGSGCRGARQPVRAGHRAYDRETRPRHGGHAALRACVHLRERALARSPGGRDALGAPPEAPRERRGSALARARELYGHRASRAGPLLPLRHEQVAGNGHGLVGRPARAAAQRGCRGRDHPAGP